MAIIILSRGKIAIVDDADIDRLMKGAKWCCDGKNYAVRHYRDDNGVRKMEKMHRVICGAKPGQIVDHVNHDTLDNTRSNLRISDHSRNGANRVKQPGTLSKFKGVYFIPSRNRWRATLRFNGKIIFIGRYATEEQAALAYNEKAKEIWGNNSLQNDVAA